MFWVPDFGSTDRLVAPMFWCHALMALIAYLPHVLVPGFDGTDVLLAPPLLFWVPDSDSTDVLIAPMFWVPGLFRDDTLTQLQN